MAQVREKGGLARPIDCVRPRASLRPLAVLAARATLTAALEAHLGRRSAARVLATPLRRDIGETIQAALLCADLRGFTELSESSPPSVVISALGDRIAGAVHAFGGEVLKFIGDGVLAIFPIQMRHADPSGGHRAKPDSELLSDLDATVAWAKSHGGDTNRLGIIDFCRGGRTVWEYAAHNKYLKAAVAFYGTVVDPPAQKTIWPKSPTELSPEMKAPVLGLYGEADRGIPLSQVVLA